MKRVKNSYRVLMVFKHYPGGEAVRKELQCLGYSVDIATKGVEALKLIKKRCFYYLLITELIVDEISGFALHIAARMKNPFLRTVALNNGGRILCDVAKEFGINRIIELSMDTEGLHKAARDILKHTVALTHNCRCLDRSLARDALPLQRSRGPSRKS